MDAEARQRTAGQPAGRARECRDLDDLITGLRARRSAALVLRGDEGIGKTTLLDYLERRASGCRVIRIAAARSEEKLDHAALQRICQPLDASLEHLPEAQATALRASWGMGDGTPDLFTLGLAVLGLLTVAARDEPLLCIVDNAQWLDPVSSAVLGFVARRLDTEGIALVLGTRDVLPALGDLPELVLNGLARHDAHVLLRRSLRGPLDERFQERLLNEAGGNPRLLLLLARDAPRQRLAGAFAHADGGRFGSHPEDSISDRLQALDDSVRRLLLLASAEPLGEPALLWRAAEELGIPAEAVDDADQAGLLEIGTAVSFCDPAMRAAVYRLAAPADRRAVHRALAQATDAQADPEGRAWHQACGTALPDESIATELERSAHRAAERCGISAAAAFLRRATALSVDPGMRARRALAAAEATRRAGDSEQALEMLVTAETAPLDEYARASVELVRARIAAGRGEDAVGRLHAAANRLAPLDSAAAREAYLDAFGAAILLGPDVRSTPAAIARDALATQGEDPPRAVDLLLDALSLQVTAGLPVAEPLLRRALDAFTADDLPPETAISWGWLAAYAAAGLWDHRTHLTITERLTSLSRHDGAIGTLPHALVHLATVHLRNGELSRAATLFSEADEALQDTRCAFPVPLHALMAAHRGREDRVPPLASGAAASQSWPRGLGGAIAQVAAMMLCNGLGRYDDVLRVGGGCLESPEPIVAPRWALPELIEAAARAGRTDTALVALDRLSEHVRHCSDDWAAGLEARARAVLSHGDAAERLYREAIDHLSAPGCRADLARAHLLFGEWLRREGRRVDARVHLREAHDTLCSMGMDAFAERARRELQASGEIARKRTADARDDLTAQELQIARLARAGLSNQEIGGQLFLSRRTVEWHLRKVFGKLGISSRVKLRDVLPDEVSAAA